MNDTEVQAKASIAAALIVRGAVEVPTMPRGDGAAPDAAGVRLRELTDYLYRLIAAPAPRDPS
jgi:hypothetical protein